MKAKALVPALALAAALLAPPLADAAPRRGSSRGHRPPAHGYYGHRPSDRAWGYTNRYRPYSRRYRYDYAPRAPYYGYGYGYGYAYPYPYGYGLYDGYGYYPPPPPPPRYRRPRIGFGIWLGF
jgi:hypothetical protein